MKRLEPMTGRVPGASQPAWNIAHRGARAFAPENTLASFRKALELGCDMLELDVHMSKDLRLMVHHDDDLVRCTDVRERFPGRTTYFISDFSMMDLQMLDAGSWYLEQIQRPAAARQPFLQTLTNVEMDEFISSVDRDFYGSGDVRIPTLEQALDLARTADVLINIELKSLPRMYPKLAEAVVALVEEFDMKRHVLISSFDHVQLEEVRRLSEVIATAVLSSDRIARPADYLKLLDADAYHPGCCDEFDSLGFGSVSGKLDCRGISEIRAAGLLVNVWTCNRLDQMRALLAAGVTGLISDFTNRVRDVLCETR